MGCTGEALPFFKKTLWKAPYSATFHSYKGNFYIVINPPEYNTARGYLPFSLHIKIPFASKPQSHKEKNKISSCLSVLVAFFSFPKRRVKERLSPLIPLHLLLRSHLHHY